MSTKRSTASEASQDSATKRVKDDSIIQQFSENVLKNIMEHLSIERRVEIFVKCPALRTAERTAPLYLNQLSLEKYILGVNETLFDAGGRKIYPGNLSLQTNWPSGVDLNKTTEEIFQHLINIYFGNRTHVKVRLFIFLGRKRLEDVEYLPEGLQIECEQLIFRSYGVETFHNLRRYLKDEKLMALSINLDKSNQMPDDDLALTAHTTQIAYDSSKGKHSISDDLILVKSGQILIQDEEILKSDVVTLAANWKERSLDLGMLLSYPYVAPEYIRDLHQLFLKSKVGAVKGKIPDPRAIPDLSKLPCITIPMTCGHEINIFSIPKSNESRRRYEVYELMMKIMQKGTAERIY